MEWDVKFVLAKLLNDMKYKEAVELINAHNDNVDAQDVDIFISGFSLVYAELLNASFRKVTATGICVPLPI